MQKNKRDKNYLALYLSTTLCIAKQNLSIGVNVVSKGSPSRILRVLRISLGITILPKSSTLLTMPVAFIFLSPFPVGNDLCVVPVSFCNAERHAGRSLPDVMRFFKTMTTNDYIRGVKDGTLTPFDGKLWQKSYYDHVIRNQQDYNEIWQYIENNPTKWIMMHERP